MAVVGYVRCHLVLDILHITQVRVRPSSRRNRKWKFGNLNEYYDIFCLLNKTYCRYEIFQTIYHRDVIGKTTFVAQVQGRRKLLWPRCKPEGNYVLWRFEPEHNSVLCTSECVDRFLHSSEQKQISIM